MICPDVTRNRMKRCMCYYLALFILTTYRATTPPPGARFLYLPIHSCVNSQPYSTLPPAGQDYLHCISSITTTATRKVTTAAEADHCVERTETEAFFWKPNVWEIKRVTTTELSLLVAKAFDLDDKKTPKQRRLTLALLPYQNRVVKSAHHNHYPD